MILNRKSAKGTSKVSLIIAITMLIMVVTVVQVEGIPTDYLAQNGVQICKAGLIDLITKLLW